MDKIDATIKGAIATALFGLFGWVMSINTDVKVNSTEISHNRESTMSNIEATKDLTKAVNDLRVFLASSLPDKKGE